MGYDKEAHRYAEDTYDYARNFAKPADSVYNNYYQKAFGGAYNTAQGLDQLGPLYSGYNMAEDNLRKQMARQGMGQSGAMQSAGRGLFNTFSQQAGQQGLQARMAKEQALSGLAGQAIGGANMGQNAIYNANTERANIAMQRAGMQNQNNMQQQQAIGNLIGSGVSLAGTLGGMMLGDPGLGNQINSLLQPTTNNYGMGSSSIYNPGMTDEQYGTLGGAGGLGSLY